MWQQRLKLEVLKPWRISSVSQFTVSTTKAEYDNEYGYRRACRTRTFTTLPPYRSSLPAVFTFIFYTCACRYWFSSFLFTLRLRSGSLVLSFAVAHDTAPGGAPRTPPLVRWLVRLVLFGSPPRSFLRHHSPLPVRFGSCAGSLPLPTWFLPPLLPPSARTHATGLCHYTTHTCENTRFHHTGSYGSGWFTVRWLVARSVYAAAALLAHCALLRCRAFVCLLFFVYFWFILLLYTTFCIFGFPLVYSSLPVMALRTTR